MNADGKTIEPGRAPRRTGRPKGSEQAVGSQELVRRCRDLMRETPPSQLTFAALARYAGVTPTLVKYYFKDRSELMVAVLRLIMQETKAPLVDTLDDMGPAEALRDFIRDLSATHMKYPYFHDLLLAEVLGGASPAGRVLFEEITDRMAVGLERMLEQGVESGALRPVNPVHLYVAILGMCEFYSAAGAIREYMTKKKSTAKDAAAYADFVYEALMNGIAGPAFKG